MTDYDLNVAITEYLEWGESMPFEERLKILLPDTNIDELSQFVQSLCTNVWNEIGEHFSELDKNAVQCGIYLSKLKKEYPQIDDDVLKRLFNQGMYYAYK